MTVSRRGFLGTAFGLGADAATGFQVTSSILEKLAESATVDKAQKTTQNSTLEEKLKTAIQKHRVAESSRNEQDYYEAIVAWQDVLELAKKEGKAETQARTLFNQTKLSYDTGIALRKPGIYQNAIKYGLEGLGFIQTSKVMLDWEDDLHLFVARASSRIGRTKESSYHYLQVLAKSNSNGELGGALSDIYSGKYTDASIRGAQSAMQALSPEEQRKAKTKLVEYGVNRLLTERPNNKKLEAERIKVVSRAYELPELLHLPVVVNAVVQQYLEDKAPYFKLNPEAFDELRSMPIKFMNLQRDNPIVAQVYTTIRRSFRQIDKIFKYIK